MELLRYSAPKEFQAATRDFLIAEEAANNLFFGIVHTLIHQPDVYPGDNYMAAVFDDGDLMGVAYRTPPYHLAMSRFVAPAAGRLFAEDYATRGDELPGVLGPPESAEAFIDAWTELRGVDAEVQRQQRIYELTEVVPVEGVPGAMRQATEDDLELITEWTTDFDVEAVGEKRDAVRGAARARAERGIENGVFFLWKVDGAPVSMAGFSGPTPNGIRINYVYTPPEHRRNGYASALTAALSQRLLDEGREFCFLFTDLANPTSNHIYQEIGYRPVRDVNMYRFG